MVYFKVKNMIEHINPIHFKFLGQVHGILESKEYDRAHQSIEVRCITLYLLRLEITFLVYKK